jgi:nicotinamidase-related amidase
LSLRLIDGIPPLVLRRHEEWAEMDAIIIVDMQIGMLDGPPKHDLRGLIDRINVLTAMVRRADGTVIWVRHCGKAGDDFEHNAAGWHFLPELTRREGDVVIEKTLNDPYVGTRLKEILADLAPRRVLVAGWATDFCVDATVRSTVSCDHHVVVVSDGHTLSDRPHLDAQKVIEHHNWVWGNLITNRSVLVLTTCSLLAERK